MGNQATCSRVTLDKLLVDGRYQRPVDERRVAKIVNNFDPKQLGTLELSKRKNGSFAIIDGQHRFEALKAVGRKQVPALVHEDLTVTEEAELFAAINMSRKQLSPVERFLAQVFAGDKRAVAISGAVTAAGFKIKNTSGSEFDSSVIRAISRIEKAFDLLGEAEFALAMQAIRDCWFGTASSTDGHFIMGFMLFWHQFGARFTEEHAERAGRCEPLILMRNARHKLIRQGGTFNGSGSTVSVLIADSLRKAIGLRGETGRKQAGRPAAAKRELAPA